MPYQWHDQRKAQCCAPPESSSSLRADDQESNCLWLTNCGLQFVMSRCSCWPSCWKVPNRETGGLSHPIGWSSNWVHRNRSAQKIEWIHRTLKPESCRRTPDRDRQKLAHETLKYMENREMPTCRAVLLRRLTAVWWQHRKANRIRKMFTRYGRKKI